MVKHLTPNFVLNKLLFLLNFLWQNHGKAYGWSMIHEHTHLVTQVTGEVSGIYNWTPLKGDNCTNHHVFIIHIIHMGGV